MTNSCEAFGTARLISFLFVTFLDSQRDGIETFTSASVVDNEIYGFFLNPRTGSPSRFCLYFFSIKSIDM